MRSLFSLSSFAIATAVHPLYPLAEQDVWQAAEPIPIHIIYDVSFNFSSLIIQVPESQTKSSFVDNASVLSPEVIKKTEDELSRSCGPTCIRTFRSIVPQIEELVSQTSSVGWKTQDSAQADAVNNALKELIGKLTKEVEYQTFSSSDVSDHCCN
jgi:hypothetical protein